jgi:uncharacterized membrane protein (DUF106 family)
VIARAKARAQAHLLEFRLFMDDPLLIFRSQRDLLSDNVCILKELLRPLLILAIPTILVTWQLDALFGRAPLRIGEPAVVSVKLHQDSIAAPEGVVVETKALFIQATGETCWRIRPVHQTSGWLRVGHSDTRLVAGSGLAYLPDAIVGRSAIEITYPGATVLGIHWLAWFIVLSMTAAFVLRRPLQVAF